MSSCSENVSTLNDTLKDTFLSNIPTSAESVFVVEKRTNLFDIHNPSALRPHLVIRPRFPSHHPTPPRHHTTPPQPYVPSSWIDKLIVLPSHQLNTSSLHINKLHFFFA
jgi:hypothetical protein